MKPIFTKKRVLIALLALLPTLSPLCSLANDTTPPTRNPVAMKVLSPEQLTQTLQPSASPTAPGVYRLSPEWVGTLTAVGDEYQKNGLKPEAPESLRLNFAFVGSKGVTLVAGQETKDGIIFSREFLFSKSLRTDAEILKNRDLSTLKSWYGKQHGTTDGWGDGKTINWSEHWMFCGLQKDGTLRCQNIFAHASRRIGERKKACEEVTPVTGQPEMVRIMNLMTGDFRPAK